MWIYNNDKNTTYNISIIRPYLKLVYTAKCTNNNVI